MLLEKKQSFLPTLIKKKSENVNFTSYMKF